MDIMKLATQLLAPKLSSNQSINSDAVQSVIGNLLGDSKNNGIDLGNIVGALKGNGLADIASSWLGDGDNADISTDQVSQLFGKEKIAAAAEQLGADPQSLLSGLQSMIPQVVDKSSQGGELLDAVGGLKGLAGLASKFFK